RTMVGGCFGVRGLDRIGYESWDAPAAAGLRLVSHDLVVVPELCTGMRAFECVAKLHGDGGGEDDVFRVPLFNGDVHDGVGTEELAETARVAGVDEVGVVQSVICKHGANHIYGDNVIAAFRERF